jgi:hypothetical protein
MLRFGAEEASTSSGISRGSWPMLTTGLGGLGANELLDKVLQKYSERKA